jgi:hypothetical protein
MLIGETRTGLLMTDHELVEAFSVAQNAIRRGGSLYFSLSDTREVAEESEERGFAVVALEGFTLEEDGGIRAHLDLIADYTSPGCEWSSVDWEEFRQTCNRDVLEFLHLIESEKRQGRLVFEVDIMHKDEFPSFFEAWKRQHAAMTRRLG